MTFPQAAELLFAALKFARDRQIPRLLINATGLTGFPSPTLAERYFLARKWAALAQQYVRVVLVVPATMIDPEKFGVIVARNAGTDAEVFATEAEALAWLTDKAGK